MAEFARNIREGSRKLTGFKPADLDGLPATSSPAIRLMHRRGHADRRAPSMRAPC
jgi:hypothetical protein